MATPTLITWIKAIPVPDVAQPAMYTLGLASDPSTGVSTDLQPRYPDNTAAADCVIACDLPLGLHHGAAAVFAAVAVAKDTALK
jgi:hypothetical protein